MGKKKNNKAEVELGTDCRNAVLCCVFLKLGGAEDFVSFCCAVL